MFLKEKWEYPLVFCELAVRQGMKSKQGSDNKLNAAQQEVGHEELATHLKKGKRTTTVIFFS